MMGDTDSPLRAIEVDLGYRGTRVVHGASLGLAAGRVTALVGPNGSGKSTLLRAMARLHTPESGDVLLTDGTSALALSPREFARLVTLLAQSRPTPTGVRVREVVGYGRHPHRGRWRGVDPDGAEAIAWAMDVTGVTAMADRPVDELSGGERQRVWLSTALAQRTHTLLLDEPTTFLDLRYQIETLDLIRDLADDHDVAVGVVLHDLDQAAGVADSVVLLDEGRVRATGPAVEVLTPDLLTEVYGIRIDVVVDPDTGRLTTRPIGRHSVRTQPTV
jgi:ferric hydroxamate transport system ATP-binding protein